MQDLPGTWNTSAALCESLCLALLAYRTHPDSPMGKQVPSLLTFNLSFLIHIVRFSPWQLMLLISHVYFNKLFFFFFFMFPPVWNAFPFLRYLSKLYLQANFHLKNQLLEFSVVKSECEWMPSCLGLALGMLSFLLNHWLRRTSSYLVSIAQGPHGDFCT